MQEEDRLIGFFCFNCQSADFIFKMIELHMADSIVHHKIDFIFTLFIDCVGRIRLLKDPFPVNLIHLSVCHNYLPLVT